MWQSKLSGWAAIALPLAFLYTLYLLYTSAKNFWNGASGFDPLVAASLHNQIVARIPIENLEEHNATIIRNWFVAYGKEATQVRGRLSRKTIKFLENVDVPKSSGSGGYSVGVTPHLALSAPGDLWGPIGGLDWDGSTHADHDWIALYRGITGDQVDMYFDMNINLVTYQEEVMPWNADWYPLERVLRTWNDMYDTGKFKSRLDNDTFTGQHPRDVRPYTPSDFQVNLAAWDEYLEAIVQRCPSCSIHNPGLVHPSIVNNFGIKGFLRDFLLNAKRPSFNFVAPGLRIPTGEQLEALFTQDKYSARWHRVRNDFEGPNPDDEEWLRNKYGYDFTQEPMPLFIGPNITARSKYFFDHEYLLGGLSGLYSWPEEWFADSVSLILPAPISPSGFLSQKATQQIESSEPWEWDSRDEVLANHDVFAHQVSCPFTANRWHKPRLFTILHAWKRLVEQGVWKVGPDGVKGGIEKFKEAAIGGRKSKYYRLGACFDEV